MQRYFSVVQNAVVEKRWKRSITLKEGGPDDITLGLANITGLVRLDRSAQFSCA
jgi:hypothetical protein